MLWIDKFRILVERTFSYLEPWASWRTIVAVSFVLVGYIFYLKKSWYKINDKNRMKYILSFLFAWGVMSLALFHLFKKRNKWMGVWFICFVAWFFFPDYVSIGLFALIEAMARFIYHSLVSLTGVFLSICRMMGFRMHSNRNK